MAVFSNIIYASVCISVCLSIIYQAATKMLQTSQNMEGLEDAETEDSCPSETANVSTEDRK